MAFILTMMSILVAVVLDCRGGFYLDVSTTLVAPFSSEVLSVILFCMYVEFVQEVHLIVIVLTLAWWCILILEMKCSTDSNCSYFGLMMHTNIRNEMLKLFYHLCNRCSEAGCVWVQAKSEDCWPLWEGRLFHKRVIHLSVCYCSWLLLSC